MLWLELSSERNCGMGRIMKLRVPLAEWAQYSNYTDRNQHLGYDFYFIGIELDIPEYSEYLKTKEKRGRSDS